MEASKEFKEKWRQLRNSIKVPEKDAKNPHFRSSYRSWEATEKALRDAGVDSHFVTINNDTQAGVEWWVEIEGEEVKVNTCLVDKAKRDPQATGGCFSYALRYCVATYLGWGMPEEDDDGNHAVGIQSTPIKPDTSFDPAKLEAELQAAPVAADKSTPDHSAMSPKSVADLLLGTINMQPSVKALQDYWTNNHQEFTALMASDQQEYERAIRAYQLKGQELSKKELENGTTK